MTNLGDGQVVDLVRMRSATNDVVVSTSRRSSPGGANGVDNTESRWPRGWRPYAALVSGFIMMAYSWGLILTYGVFFEFYDEEFLPSATDLQLSLIGGTQSLLVLLLSIIVGRLLDARMHCWILVFGAVTLVLAFVCLSFAGRHFGLIWFTSGFTAGLGMTCFFMYSSHNAIEWFPLNPYFATGVTSAGAGFGGVIYPPILSFLTKKFGFSTSVRIMAGITGLMVLAACVLAKPKPAIKKPKLGPVWKANTWIRADALKSTSHILLCASMWFSFAGYFPLAFHVAEWAESKRLARGFPAYWFVAMVNGSSVVGRVGSGLIASRWNKPIAVQAVASFLATLSVMLFWLLDLNEASVTAFCVLLGILAGAMFGLPASGVAHIIPRKHENSLGLWTGMMWSSCAPFSLLGPLIGGLLRQRYGLNAIGFWAGLNLLVASILQMLAHRANNSDKRKDSNIESPSRNELLVVNLSAAAPEVWWRRKDLA